MLYGWNRWQWWTHQAAPLIRYWKVREFSAVISARRVKNITKLADPEMRKCQKKQRFYFLSCYHEITILLSSKAMLFSKMSHKLSDQRQIFLWFFIFLIFLKWLVDPWCQIPVLGFLVRCTSTGSDFFSECVEHFQPFHQSHTSGCVKALEVL